MTVFIAAILLPHENESFIRSAWHSTFRYQPGMRTGAVGEELWNDGTEPGMNHFTTN